MNNDDDRDWLRQDFLDLVAKFGELERQIQAEITEYKKTINNALGLLSREFIEFINKDVAERKARQKRQDIKDAIIVLFGLLIVLLFCSMIGLLIYLLTRKVVVV